MRKMKDKARREQNVEKAAGGRILGRARKNRAFDRERVGTEQIVGN
jgi:hypothetical protein